MRDDNIFHNKEYILEVAKERSFSRAARNLYISQPSLSAAVKNTENLIGMPIFDRSTSPIGLTEVGERYVETARQIRSLEDDFTNFSDSVKGLIAGTISIGATNFLTSVLLPPLIKAFATSYPEVTINLTEGNTADLEELLFNGELDFVIEANDFDDAVYERRILTHEHLVLAVPKSFPVYERVREYELSREEIKQNVHLKHTVKAVPFSYFADDPFILLKEGNDIRVRAERIMEYEAFKPKIMMTLDQQMTAFHLVCRGMGIAFLSDTLIKNMPLREEFALFRLDNGNAHRDIYLYHKRSRYLTPAMKKFLE